jgi:alpha-glucosidase (family GH31 glycosyl hydrolase)
MPENLERFGFDFLLQVEGKRNARRHLFEEAKAGGFLVAHPSGSPYMIPNTSFEAAMVDLTDADARKWLKEVMHAMIKTGVKGWMADFGESLPLDAVLRSEEDPKEAHNRYPEMWAELNREVVQESGDGDLVFFMRAAYQKSPRYASLFWEGDQMVSWQRHDGIKSAVVGLLSGGISGFALNHSDIGMSALLSLQNPFHV